MHHHRFRQHLQFSTRPMAVCLRSSPRHSPSAVAPRLFPTRSPPHLLNAAAGGGLEPPSERRLRGAYPHLRHGTARRPASRSWHTCNALHHPARDMSRAENYRAADCQFDRRIGASISTALADLYGVADNAALSLESSPTCRAILRARGSTMCGYSAKWAKRLRSRPLRLVPEKDVLQNS